MRSKNKSNNAIERIEQKLDWLEETLGEIRAELGVYNSQLKDHIRRTEILEKKHEGLPGRLLQYVSIAGGMVALAKVLTSL
jgi:chromosome segregation ATPase